MSNPTYFIIQSPGRGADPLEGKYASGSEKASAEQATPLSDLRGLYWLVQVPGYKEQRTARSGLHVLSTEEIATVMDDGYIAKAISGPFRMREEAELSFERYWEMVLGDD